MIMRMITYHILNGSPAHALSARFLTSCYLLGVFRPFNRMRADVRRVRRVMVRRVSSPTKRRALTGPDPT